MDEKTDLQEIYGQVIRRERQDRSMTIKELAEKAGLSEIYLGEIERGQKYPSANVLENIARALDLDLAEFFELIAEEIRGRREPEMTRVIGFTVPVSGQPRRTVRHIVDMLDEGDVESIASFSAFLLSKHLGQS